MKRHRIDISYANVDKLKGAIDDTIQKFIKDNPKAIFAEINVALLDTLCKWYCRLGEN